jgi:hypothetical protein
MYKLIVAHLVKKFIYFVEPDGALSFLQEPATGSYPEPDEFNPHPFL